MKALLLHCKRELPQSMTFFGPKNLFVAKYLSVPQTMYKAEPRHFGAIIFCLGKRMTTLGPNKNGLGEIFLFELGLKLFGALLFGSSWRPCLGDFYFGHQRQYRPKQIYFWSRATNKVVFFWSRAPQTK